MAQSATEQSVIRCPWCVITSCCDHRVAVVEFQSQLAKHGTNYQHERCSLAFVQSTNQQLSTPTDRQTDRRTDGRRVH